MAFSVGETLQAGKYHLDSLLEERPWGMTFLATHLNVEQQVLIKTFQATETVDGPSQTQVESFIRYAQKLTRFHHPRLARVSCVFEETQGACMVSEFVQGEPLSQLTQTSPLDEAIALQSIIQVTQGLHALHRHGLLHLNLRPSRILKRKDEGDLVLIGLNSRFSSHPDETEGKPYSAPEPLQSAQPVGIVSEIYGLSATLYTLVTGVVPVAPWDRKDTPLTPPRQLRSSLSPALEDAILRGMAMDSRDRPQSMKAWLQSLPNISSAASQSPKIQVPASWKVKLPAFRDAGFKNSVSTVITAEPQAQNAAQQTSLQSPDSPQTSIQNVPHSDELGHPELDSILTEFPAESVSPIAPPTTLQVSTEPLLQSEVTSSPSPVSNPRTAAENISTPSMDAPQEAVPLTPADLKSPAAVSQSLPESALVEAHIPTQLDLPTMTTAFPQKSSRFPKWALFWCALVAACSGLGAGLWFRVQLAQQFASPVSPIQPSPLDELRSLDTKEEKFLPTDSSVIPEQKSDETVDYTDSPLESADGSDDEALDADPGLNASPDPFEERGLSPWNARDRGQDRFSREPSVETDLPVVPNDPETFIPDSPDVLEPDSFSDEGAGLTIDSEEPGISDIPEPIAVPDSTGEAWPQDSFSSNYTAPDSTSNTF